MAGTKPGMTAIEARQNRRTAGFDFIPEIGWRGMG
jgi:hypothetical protein